MRATPDVRLLDAISSPTQREAFLEYRERLRLFRRMRHVFFHSKIHRVPIAGAHSTTQNTKEVSHG